MSIAARRASSAPPDPAHFGRIQEPRPESLSHSHTPIIGGTAADPDHEVGAAEVECVPDKLASTVRGGYQGIAPSRRHQSKARSLGHFNDSRCTVSQKAQLDPDRIPRGPLT